MDTMNYAPKCIYKDINSTLETLKEQSNLLNSSIKNIETKCQDLDFISENEIDELINLIRNYTLVKEVCLEKSNKILPNIDYTSIYDLSRDVERHRENSLKILNEVLYYAYEFLKIQSKNVITDSLLQDHHEKLQTIINSMLNEFVNIDDIVKQLEPYKIAILYITRQLPDLTQYAEILNNNFGAILFYNIISGNNLDYDINRPCPYIENNHTIETSSKKVELQEEVSEPLEETSIEEFQVEEVELQEEVSEPLEETPIEEIQTEEIELQEEVSEPLEETPIEEIQTEEIELQEEVSKPLEETPIEEIQTEEIEPQEEVSVSTVDNINFYEKIVTSITDRSKYINTIIYNEDNFNEEISFNTICDYIISKEFACASMLFSEYSKASKNMQLLYNEYGLSIGDPCINYDYANVFINDTIEPLHSWLQFSTLFREMFTSQNKASECYNYMSYMNSLIQSMNSSIVSNIKNLSGALSVFEEVGYNMDYILGVKLFYKKNDIISHLKQQALEMLNYCKQTIGIWTHKGMIAITRYLFADSGYVYYLIKEISLGNFKVLDSIKQYCYSFSDENGHMLSKLQLDNKINQYLHELLINNKRNDTDINIGYRTTFIKRFTHILEFLFFCVEKLTAFDVNYINETNVEHYSKLKDTLNEFINTNLESLHKGSTNNEFSKMDKVGMVCLAKTFEHINSFINDEASANNYYYCELLKTGHFMLDDNYIPYINDSIDNVDGFTINDRIQRHLQDCKYINSWKDAIKNHVKKLNIGSINLIVSYLKDTNNFNEELETYLDELSNLEYNIESISDNFKYRMDRLCLSESVSSSEILFKILNAESIVKEIVIKLSNYGFYNMFLEYLEKYALKISEESYSSRNDIINKVGNSIGYDSDYYNDIVKYTTNNLYGMADTLLSMYFNGEEYPKLVNNSNIQQYDEIFKQFTQFCTTYADDLSSPNGYIFMNEFYDRTIKPIVLERFAGSYDCVKSDELIDSWSKGQGTTNVVYDILTNIGFSIEKSIQMDNRTFKMVLSNYEKNNSQPYIIPENTIFLNGIYNIAQADRNLNSLNINEDTFIIMDYALNLLERKHVLEVIGKISHGNKVIIADRCVIMFLTTIPSNIRKLALKVCSLCDVSSSISYSANFRNEFIKSYINQGGSNLLLGRKYLGKTFIVDTMTNVLTVTEENLVLKIDALNDNMSTPQLIASVCKESNIKINPFSDWSTFEASMTRYINKHPNKKVYLLIDNADSFIESCMNTNINDKTSPMFNLRKLSQQFKDRFKFVLTGELSQEVIDYAEKFTITYEVLKPLNYDETITMFEDYLNASKVSISDFDVRVMLVSLAFGNPEIVKFISKQILSEVSKNPDCFNDTFNYELSQDTIYSALYDDNFINVILPIFLKTVIGNKEANSIIIPILYGIVYYLYEHSNISIFSVEDVSKILNIFDLEESSNIDIKNGINQLCTIGVVKQLNDNKYFLSHNAYRYYFGSKEFAFDMLDYFTKILKKEGII